MDDRKRPGCVYRWNKPDGETMFVYVVTNEDGRCIVNPIDLVLDVNTNKEVAAVDLESLYERPIKMEEFLDS